ncbi:hypothetical protein BTHE68_61330 (plasmid) [Burkholderia sp. THE68]|uniref:hypothetical protein n=1 Tax=Burkholderiaceae TaxID=119060 RepID=UPI0013194BCE|nr:MULTISPECIES: hypothetical protein [Burkholderiaceae]BBU32399.1 hypothetical protein BTHE68_61330 [Burkholderia sp. THE68]BCQ27125.1 hypothetical protein NK8_53140 [Caballeronia sp. NK8]
MKVRFITYVNCPCGHRGSIVESIYDDGQSHWYQATLHDLSHAGHYDGADRLFAENTPACAACGLSLTPEHVDSNEYMTRQIGRHAANSA